MISNLDSFFHEDHLSLCHNETEVMISAIFCILDISQALIYFLSNIIYRKSVTP